MKRLLREEGLAKATRWYLWSKTAENFAVMLFMILIMGFLTGSMVWFLRQISMMGW